MNISAWFTFGPSIGDRFIGTSRLGPSFSWQVTFRENIEVSANSQLQRKYTNIMKSKKSLVSLSKINAITSYINFILSAVLTFLVSPLLVGYFGTSTYGVLKSCQKFMDFATALDGRSTQALKWVIAECESRNDFDEKRQAVGSALKVWLWFLPLLVISTTALIYLVPELIKDLPLTDHPMTRYVCLVLAGNVILTPLLQIPDSILMGMHRGYQSTIIRGFWIVVTNVMFLTVAHMGFGIVALTIVILISSFMNGVCIFVLAKFSIPWFGVNKPSKARFRKFFKFSGWMIGWSFVLKLFLASEVVLIGFLIGSELVTYYIFMSYISNFGSVITSLTVSSVVPGLGRLIGEKNIIKARNVVKNLREIILFLGVIFAGGMLALNQSFVTLWVGEKFYLGDTVNLLIVILLIQTIFMQSEQQIQDLGLQIQKRVIIGFAGTIFGFLLAVAFYKLFGGKIEHILVGVIAGRLVLNILLPKLVNDLLKIETIDYSKYLFASILVIGCFFMGNVIFIDSWWHFCAWVFTVGIVLTCSAFGVVLSRDSRGVILRSVWR